MPVDAAAPNIDPDILPLHRLALDLRWSWNHATDELWRRIDPDLWAQTHNPWVVLRTVSHPRMAQMLADPEFRDSLQRLSREADEAAQAPTWFQQAARRIRPDVRRLFQHGVHAERGAADLRRRARQRRRRSAEGGERPRRTGGGSGPALPTGLFPPGNRPGRLAAGAVSL